MLPLPCVQDAFIGFGGNVVREKVKEGAAWYIYSMQELIDELTNPVALQPSNVKVVDEDGGSFGDEVHYGCSAGRRRGVELGASPTPLTAK